jgi:tetratricopeptide (TPR) repeat protein
MRTLVLALVFIGIVLMSPVNAQTRVENWQRCSTTDPDIKILGCTAVIESGQETTDGLAAAYNNRGGAKARKGDLDGALADYTRAIELDPKSAIAYYDRGLAKYDEGDLDGALADDTRAIELDPKSVNAYGNRGFAKAAKGDLDGALADYTRVIELDPKDVQSWYTRGIARSATHDFNGALGDFQKAAAMLASQGEGADYVGVWTWLTRARLGMRQEATRDLAAWVTRRQNDRAITWPLTIARLVIGQQTEAAFLISVANQCEGYFFAGALRLVDHDTGGARDFFQKSVATGETTNATYIAALAELRSLTTGR